MLLLAVAVGYIALVGLVPIVVDQRGDFLEIRNPGPGVRGATFTVYADGNSCAIPIGRIDRGITRVPLSAFGPDMAGAAIGETVIRGRRLGVPYEWVSVLRMSPPGSSTTTQANPCDR
jgi:hypothetical protein